MRIIFCILISLQINAQDSLLFGAFPFIDGKINYTTILSIDSTTKDNLFIKVKEWAVDSYKSQKSANQAEDKEMGYMAYKGFLKTVLYYKGGILKGKPYSVDLYHTIKFYIKDNKIKIVFTDLETISHDVASDYIEGQTGRSTKPTLLESLDNNVTGGDKRKERIMGYVYEDAKQLNKQILKFLDSIFEKMKTKKSEFDF